MTTKANNVYQNILQNSQLQESSHTPLWGYYNHVTSTPQLTGIVWLYLWLQDLYTIFEGFMLKNLRICIAKHFEDKNAFQ